jgi:hypothetical protein
MLDFRKFSFHESDHWTPSDTAATKLLKNFFAIQIKEHWLMQTDLVRIFKNSEVLLHNSIVVRQASLRCKQDVVQVVIVLNVTDKTVEVFECTSQDVVLLPFRPLHAIVEFAKPSHLATSQWWIAPCLFRGMQGKCTQTKPFHFPDSLIALLNRQLKDNPCVATESTTKNNIFVCVALTNKMAKLFEASCAASCKILQQTNLVVSDDDDDSDDCFEYLFPITQAKKRKLDSLPTEHKKQASAFEEALLRGENQTIDNWREFIHAQRAWTSKVDVTLVDCKPAALMFEGFKLRLQILGLSTTPAIMYHGIPAAKKDIVSAIASTGFDSTFNKHNAHGKGGVYVTPDLTYACNHIGLKGFIFVCLVLVGKTKPNGKETSEMIGGQTSWSVPQQNIYCVRENGVLPVGLIKT